ncbi:MAG: helix-turn-helix transcriptional regulator [Pseudomonas sp.]|nr:helix-turn-helix transcriptional regulator [Pseudomonas sp.]
MALTHILYAPGEIALQIAGNAKALRLSKNLSRRALAAQSGVAESTLKRFETTGKVSLDALLLIAMSLGVGEQMANLFIAPPPLSLQELKSQTRLRGRR